MIKFFRHIRRSLIQKNQMGKYFKYAIGEILLVVIGIIIALQVNNWNESHKDKLRFKMTLEQIYNALDSDFDKLSRVNSNLQQQLKIIDSLIYNPLDIEKDRIPIYGFYAAIERSKRLESDVNFYLKNLELNKNDIDQINLIKDISSYATKDRSDVSNNFEEGFIESILLKLELPNPVLVFGYSALNDFENVNPNLFTDKHRQEMLVAIQTEKFKNALISASRKIELSLIFSVDNKNDILSHMQSIRDFYPEVKLFHNDVGIVGTATKKGWDESIPLKLTNAALNTWELEIELVEGEVKFRTNNSWTKNWGGNSFPDGNSIYFGDNIKVKAGTYRVVLDLNKKQYQFIRLQND